MALVVIQFLVLVSLLASAETSVAGIYKYEDERGVIHFTNVPRDPRFKIYIRESSDDPAVRSTSLSRRPAAPDTDVFDHLISEFSEKYQVEFALIKAIIRAESGFNPFAISRKGARGLMQLMPETAERMSVTNIFDPRDNIEGGVRYLKYLLWLFNNDLRLSLAAYNAGENLVYQLGTIPPYRETIDYVRKVLDYYRQYR